jgi:hypothetical protein
MKNATSISGHISEILLNILQSTGQPPQKRNFQPTMSVKPIMRKHGVHHYLPLHACNTAEALYKNVILLKLLFPIAFQIE